MSIQRYRSQVELLLAALPEIARESCFALHGGTAINMFVRNMPRLSVDIDLTYLPVETRDRSLVQIENALGRIKERILKVVPGCQVTHLRREAKLMISSARGIIKVEVNLIKRGCLAPPRKLNLCERAQTEFGAYGEVQVVDDGHLFGGKICAALDRQHPRDLFDIRQLLDLGGITADIRRGFLFYLVSSNRTIEELLAPALKDQRSAFENQFSGMTLEPFEYEGFEHTRLELIRVINSVLTKADREFLLSMESGDPDWGIHDFQAFPAVQWKLKNVRQLQQDNPLKHKKLCDSLKSRLF